MSPVRESVDATNSRIGPINPPGRCGPCGKELTRGGAGAPCAGEAEGGRSGQRGPWLRRREAAPVVRWKASFLQRGGPFAETVDSSLVEIGRFRGAANRRVGEADLGVAGGSPGCAQAGLSIQGLWSHGSARETGLFAIDGPWKEGPGDEADRKRARSTRTLGRFSAQGTPGTKGGAKLRSCFQVRGA